MRLAIIPARGGSVRIPKKNIRLFHGDPIIAYSIAAARATELFDAIWVSTDDDLIAKVATARGALVHARRSALCHDDVGTQEVVGEVLADLQAKVYSGEKIETVCCIYPCAPMLTKEDIERAYLHLAPGRFAFAVGAHPLRDAGMFYLGWAPMFLQGAPLIHPTSVMIPIEEERCIDINTEADWKKAEAMYAAWLHSKEVS